MSFITLKDIVKRFGKGTGITTALNGINLTIERGSFTSIIGRSGSGKSTLLSTVGGLIRPDQGNVYFENENMYELKDTDISRLRRKKIGFVFQSFNLIPEFTVLENIYLPSYLDQQKPDEEFVHIIMEMLELMNCKKKYPNELSGGEQQRTALARALSVKPDILLADEPTGNLDIRSGENVLESIRYCYRKFNQTTLLVTHDLDIAQHSERIITLEDGKIVNDSLGEIL